MKNKFTVIDDETIIERDFDEDFDNSVPPKGYSLRDSDLNKALTLLQGYNRVKLAKPISNRNLTIVKYHIHNFYDYICCRRHEIKNKDLLCAYDKDTYLREQITDHSISIEIRKMATAAAKANDQVIKDACMLADNLISEASALDDVFYGLEELEKLTMQSYEPNSIMEQYNERWERILSLICETDSRHRFSQAISIGLEETKNRRETRIKLFDAMKSTDEMNLRGLRISGN